LSCLSNITHLKELMSDVIYGRNSVEEFLLSNRDLDKVYIDNKLRGEFEKRIRKLTKDRSIPLIKVPKEKLDKEIRKDHQGILAFVSPIAFVDLDDVISQVYEKNEQPLLLVLDGITDVRNLGAIARSAYVFGAHALVIGTKGTARINDDAMKASSGALSHIPVCRENGMSVIIEKLKHNGIPIVATTSSDAIPLDESTFDGAIAVVIGDEGRGVSDFVLANCNTKVMISQRRDFDSLNASVAAGIVLYEISKNRLTK